MMDSPAATQFFRQLLRHPACRQQRRRQLLWTTAAAAAATPTKAAHQQQTRHYAVRRGNESGDKSNETRWQQRTDHFPKDRSQEFAEYPTVTEKDLRRRKERPRRVKMLLRDFIDDSLYNPSYGYFSKQAVIFSPGEPFDFNSLPNEPAFHAELGRRYTEFEDHLDETAGMNPTRQLWHTPTELFRPHYGEAMARYLVSNYRLTTFPYNDLIIYEMGAGRGTLMLNVLDYIRDMDPLVYERTKFRIIEISPALAAMQKRHLAQLGDRGHAERVEIINRSIFDWDEYVSSPCFFLAMEVLDNFAHDCVRYDVATHQALQCNVLIDDEGDFFEFYAPHLDPVASRYLLVRQAATEGRHPTPFLGSRVYNYLSSQLTGRAVGSTGGSSPSSSVCTPDQDRHNQSLLARLAASLASGGGGGSLPLARQLRSALSSVPGMPNLSLPEYLPTRLMQFFDILQRYFPAHRLLISDFHSLPNAVKGLNAPVVQTRYKRRMVPVRTPLVHQGYFDILFPTDFAVTEKIYQALTGKLTHVMSHEDFMTSWAYVEDTATRSGENPLLTYYKNASVMVTR